MIYVQNITEKTKRILALLSLKIATDKKYNKREIRDVWLMEYSGGPNTDCDSYPNYDMDDLVDWYWPALVGGVLKYTNKDEVDYVGYSSGGGVGIRSYEKYYLGNSSIMGYYVNDSGSWEGFSLPANFVDHMALIAPMGAFDGDTQFTDLMDSCGDNILNELSGRNHFNRHDILKAGFERCKGGKKALVWTVDKITSEGQNISYNFWSDITNAAKGEAEVNPKLSSINELMLIKGAWGGFADDGIVPDADIIYMYSNSNATQKYRTRVFDIHAGMTDTSAIYDPLLNKFLNDESYTWLEEKTYDIKSS